MNSYNNDLVIQDLEIQKRAQKLEAFVKRFLKQFINSLKYMRHLLSFFPL